MRKVKSKKAPAKRRALVKETFVEVKVPVEPTTVREALDVLDNFFLNPDINMKVRAGLWDVLSALRGPDRDGESFLKDHVTVAIRAAAFPRSAVSYYPDNASGIQARADIYPTAYVRPEPDLYSGTKFASHSHFRAHGIRAAIALGLDEQGPK